VVLLCITYRTLGFAGYKIADNIEVGLAALAEGFDLSVIDRMVAR
jgi:hypothetical protein